LFTSILIVFAIEVSGHITEDTTWSPDNNPYLVVDDVYVDDDVTLTILPGTIVKFNAARLASYQDMDNFVYYNGANIAKMIQVDGRLIANGTEEEPITFTRIQDSLYYHWGVIYLREEADLCSFKYCHFEYSAYLLIVLGIIPSGAVSMYNEEAIIEHCDFVDNFTGVYIRRYPQKVIIKNSTFFNIDNISPTYPGYHVNGSIEISAGEINESDIVLIAGNEFINSNNSYFNLDIFDAPAYVINNQFSVGGFRAAFDSHASSYIYNNNFINCTEGLRGGYPNDSLFIKKNNFIGGYQGINISYAYVEISDNYFEGCDLDAGLQCSGKVFNNIVNSGEIRLNYNIDCIHNILSNYDGPNNAFSGYKVHNKNNIFYNNLDLFSDSSDTLFTNCIILANDNLHWWPYPHGTDTFRNCIIDFPLEYPLIDGGGNIIVDSIQAQSIFIDIQNGDFHLIEGSLAIDAGFDTLGYYYPFDMDYNHRVWDGDNNGTAIIDIGPYEYGAPAFGGIQGVTYNPSTNVSVDYVLLKINNQPGEFTFSDSLGNFQYKLPAGIYDVYAERVFYEDVIEYQVEVIDGQFTNLFIPMTETVNIEENTIILFSNDFNLTNYPNPFNPSTTLTFSIQNDMNVELSIFNIKGQKVTTLINEQMQKGKHTAIWSGLDSNNKPVSSGIYLYKVKADNKESVKRMLLLK